MVPFAFFSHAGAPFSFAFKRIRGGLRDRHDLVAQIVPTNREGWSFSCLPDPHKARIRFGRALHFRRQWKRGNLVLDHLRQRQKFTQSVKSRRSTLRSNRSAMEFPMMALATLGCASNSEVYFCRMLITWQPYLRMRS